MPLCVYTGVFLFILQKKNMLSFIRSRWKSFGFAITGLATLIRSERNMWIHLAATVIVVVAGLWQKLESDRWIMLCIAIGLVWIGEAFNTAIEKLCNVVSKETHPVIKQVKDISAAAVLISAIVAVAIGAFVFLG